MAVLIVGGGAQGKYAAETFILRGTPIAGVVDTNASPRITWPAEMGLPVFGMAEDWARYGREPSAHALVCVADPDRRRELWELVRGRDLVPHCAVHPQAVLASTADMGDGCIVNAGAVVQPFARIGYACIIHATCVVEHDCAVGPFCTLAPGVKLAGWARVEEGATIQTGAVVAPNVTVGAGTVVGAGSVVLDDVPAGVLVAGAPAAVKRQLR